MSTEVSADSISTVSSTFKDRNRALTLFELLLDFARVLLAGRKLHGESSYAALNNMTPDLIQNILTQASSKSEIRQLIREALITFISPRQFFHDLEISILTAFKEKIIHKSTDYNQNIVKHLLMLFESCPTAINIQSLAWETYFSKVCDEDKDCLELLKEKFFLLHDFPLEENLKVLMKILTQKLTPPTIDSGIKDGFETPYLSSDLLLNNFESFVRKEILEKFQEDESRYMALYFSIVQSSGYGKTRMLLEAGKKHLNMVYACLRNKNSSGYPPCNVSVQKMITELNDGLHYKLFLASIYLIAIEGLGLKIENNEVSQAATDIAENQEQTLPLHRFENDASLRKFERFWKDVEDLFRRCMGDDQFGRDALELVKNWNERYRNVRSSPNKVQKNGILSADGIDVPSEIIMVFDEARFLIESDDSKVSPFRELRRAHRDLNFVNFVLVFVDTISTVSNFSPSRYHDDSARTRSKKIELLPVFYHMLTYDSCLRVEPLNSPNLHQELAECLSFGRPLWNTIFFSGRIIERPQILEAIELAKVKLANNDPAILNNNYYGTLAALSVRFGINGSMDHTIASSLVSSHMATAIYLGEDRLRMMVQYVPEPILAEAACKLLHSGNNIIVHLEQLQNAVISGLVDAGGLGELIVRIVVSLYYDMLHQEVSRSLPFYTDPIKVQYLLSEFLPLEYVEEYQERFHTSCFNWDDPKVVALKDAEIAFTSFEVVEDLSRIILTESVIEFAFKRRIAFRGPEKQRGFDVVFPLRYRKDGLTRYTVKLHQIKLESVEGSKRFQAAGGKLSLDYCFPDNELPEEYIAVYVEASFDVGISSKPIAHTLELASNHYHNYGNHAVVLNFAHSRLLDENMKAFFKSLKSKRIDKINRSENAAALKKMSPFRFAALADPTEQGEDTLLPAPIEQESSSSDIASGTFTDSSNSPPSYLEEQSKSKPDDLYFPPSQENTESDEASTMAAAMKKRPRRQ